MPTDCGSACDVYCLSDVMCSGVRTDGLYESAFTAVRVCDETPRQRQQGTFYKPTRRHAPQDGIPNIRTGFQSVS